MSRIQSIDVVRVIAIIAVICIHVVPFTDQPTYLVGDNWSVASVVNQMARFAVPFFFIVSGYLWAQKVSNESNVYPATAMIAKRIFIVYVAWCAIYLLPTNFVAASEIGRFGWIRQLYRNAREVVLHPINAVFGGTSGHLWYLPALLCALGITAIFAQHRKQRMLTVLAILMYLIGLLGKAYADTPFGFHSEFNLRNGPFFSLIFFATGYFLKKQQPKTTWILIGLLVSMLGAALHFTELLALHSYWGTSLRQDYVIGTYFYGLGIAMIALSGSSYLNLQRVAIMGPSVLGIYAVHPIFIDLLRPLIKPFAGNAIISITFVLAVFGLSYAVVRVLARYAKTRRFVM